VAKKLYSVEPTVAGLQFVIPGTEKPAPAPRIAYTSDGSQLVIPGAERISERALAQRFVQRPLRPRAGQRGLAGAPLFGRVRSG